MKTKKILIGLLFIFFSLCAAAAVFLFYLSRPVSQDEEVQFEEISISKGMTAKSIGVMLYNKKIIRSAAVFYGFARYSKIVVKAGVYQISPAMTYMEILRILEKGKDAQIVVSIPEGLTISLIAKILENKRITSAEGFIAAANDPVFAAKYSIPSQSVEGYIFPDTYYLLPDMQPEQVLDILISHFFSKISSIEGLNQKTNDELFYIVRLASIVEREYRRADEAPLIASVFANRLRYNIGLYSCATIVYILTEIKGKDHPDRITEKDTRIESPYNTYLYAGLPPAPISNPGLTALKAAANPPKTDYYYFRLIDEETGTHTFTKNFDDHKEAGKTISTKQRAGS